MTRALTLLTVAIVTASSAGCNCCPCLRNICPWNVCGNLCAPRAPAPVCPPAPVYAAPVCPPAAAPMYAAPQQYPVPQYAAQQYAAAPAAVPVFNEAARGTPCATCPAPCATCPAPQQMMYAEMGCGMPYTMADPGCGYMDSGMMMPQQQQMMMMDPSPAP